MIASFKHDCGCEFIRRENGYAQEFTCETHGGEPLSFGSAAMGARGAVSVPHAAVEAALARQEVRVTQRVTEGERTFTFTDAEAKRLTLLANCEHYDVLMERRKLVQVQERMRDDSWSNRIAELNTEDTLMRGIVGKLLRRD